MSRSTNAHPRNDLIVGLDPSLDRRVKSRGILGRFDVVCLSLPARHGGRTRRFRMATPARAPAWHRPRWRELHEPTRGHAANSGL
jgi:hypothetical protein